MKWKYRIVKWNNRFYPQYRRCFIWWHFTGGYTDCSIEFVTIGEAESYIKERIENRLGRLSKHEVVKEYNI